MPDLATLLNPLTPLYMAADGVRVVGRVVTSVPGAVVDTTARGIATATEPMAGAVSDMAGFLSLGVKEGAATFRDTNKKILIGEVVLVGGVVALAAIAAWYLSKSPEARAATKNAVLTGGKFLLTKGRG